MKIKKTYDQLNYIGSVNPQILAICDPPSEGVWERGEVMAKPHMRVFGEVAESCGFTSKNFCFLSPCRPIPEEHQSSESRIGKWLEADREVFCSAVDELIQTHDIKLILSMGKTGNRQLAGRSVKITKARGKFTKHPISKEVTVLPIYSPAHILARPEDRGVWESDFLQAGALRDCGWSEDNYKDAHETIGYKWCLDLQSFLDNPPRAIALDCETVGLEWHKEGFRVLTAAFTTSPGNSFVVPLDADYWNNHELRGESNKHLPDLTEGDVSKLKDQFRTLLGNAKVGVVGHNLSFDIHALRTTNIHIAQWYMDTIQLAFTVDENMKSKSLADCTRRWVPSLSGYSDIFDTQTDKSRMQEVSHDEMLEYAGGDTDATFRLAKTLIAKAKEDSRNWKTLTNVQMPALRAFVEMEENGVLIDKDALRGLGEDLGQREAEAYEELIGMVKPKVLRRHEGNWNFGRADFIRDILFSPKKEGGLGIEPLVFTKTTATLRPEDRIPSTSSKDHLAFFDDVDFVHKLINYQKLSKMRTTYVGMEPKEELSEVGRLKSGGLPRKVANDLERAGLVLPKSKSTRRRKRVLETARVVDCGDRRYRVDEFGNVKLKSLHQPTGFWQYLVGSDKIHPSYLLHGTVTGRTSSRSPNSQNFPKRGELAKMFRKIFMAPQGRLFLEADLSQAELRVAAWMANEPEMIRVYSGGGDIHAATAAAVIGVSEEQLNLGRGCKIPLIDVANDWPGSGAYLRSLSSGERKTKTISDYCEYKRFQAKAVNFGFLYGMGWRGFKRYAKLDYGIELTDEEAQEMRARFFEKYRGLLSWHVGMERFVKEHKYVRALHGSLRHLPSVDSSEDNIQAMAVRQAINSPVQRFGSDIGLIALARFVRDCPPELARPSAFIHDANIVDADGERNEEAASALKYYMQSPPLQEWFGITPPFPILSDVSRGPNLGEMEEIEAEAIPPSWYRAGESAPTPELEETWETLIKRGVILKDS